MAFDMNQFYAEIHQNAIAHFPYWFEHNNQNDSDITLKFIRQCMNSFGQNAPYRDSNFTETEKMWTFCSYQRGYRFYFKNETDATYSRLSA